MKYARKFLGGLGNEDNIGSGGHTTMSAAVETLLKRFLTIKHAFSGSGGTPVIPLAVPSGLQILDKSKVKGGELALTM